MDTAELMRSRWRGQRGRLEVWYTTVTDPATGTGLWLHHELVAPTGDEPPYAHGWAAAFPGGGVAPVVARFGPAPWPVPTSAEVFALDGVTVTADRLAGTAGALSWELHERQQGPFGSVVQADVARGRWNVCLLSPICDAIQLKSPSMIEQSFSSLSMMIATSESGRRKSARCWSRTSSRPCGWAV